MIYSILLVFRLIQPPTCYISINNFNFEKIVLFSDSLCERVGDSMKKFKIYHKKSLMHIRY